MLQQSPTYQISNPSLIFCPIFCIASPPYLVEEVVRRLITHVNINKKHRICMLFAFVLFVIVLVILIVEKKNDLSFLIKKFHRETCFYHNVVVLGIVNQTYNTTLYYKELKYCWFDVKQQSINQSIIYFNSIFHLSLISQYNTGTIFFFIKST